MDNNSLIIIGLVVVAIVVIAAILLMRKRRSAHLKGRFGPEYDRTLHEIGNPSKAERELERREQRVAKLHIHTLSRVDAERFISMWRTQQERFVDDPEGAVIGADNIVTDVMRTKGYPMGEFEQRAADISVDHPHVVEHYRAAHNIALAHEAGQATTEDLRMAMKHFRALFAELVESGQVEHEEAHR